MEEDRGSPPSLRAPNRLRVIQALQVLGVTSRADLARRTGLSRSTVSTIVADLQAEGLVVDRDPDPDLRVAGGGGRPPALIALDPGAGLAVGIDFGKRHLAVAVADLSHELVAEEWREMPDDYAAEEGMDAAAELVELLLDGAGADRGRVLGVGMGLPGPVHAAAARSARRRSCPAGSACTPRSEMGARLDLPVRRRQRRQPRRAGRVRLGRRPRLRGPRLPEGRDRHRRGHRARRPAVQRRRRHRRRDRPHHRSTRRATSAAAATAAAWRPTPAGPPSSSCCSRSLGETLTLEDVLERAVEGDAGCRRALADAGRHIGAAVANLCNLFNPERIVVGGSIGRRRRHAARPDAARRSGSARSRARRRTWRSSPASWASGPSCSAPSRWCFSEAESAPASGPAPAGRNEIHGNARRRRSSMSRFRFLAVLAVLAGASWRSRRAAMTTTAERRRRRRWRRRRWQAARSRCCCRSRRPPATSRRTGRNFETQGQGALPRLRDHLLERRPGRGQAAAAGRGRDHQGRQGAGARPGRRRVGRRDRDAGQAVRRSRSSATTA